MNWRPRGRRAAVLAVVVAAGSAVATGLVGCWPKYTYPEPSAAAWAKMEALARPGLEVDTGAVPPHPPSEPFVTALKHEHGKYFVPARVNGTPCNLMLDFGSWVTLGLMPYMVRTSKAALTGSTMETRTLDGDGEMRTGQADTLQIGDVTLGDIPFAMSNRDLTVKVGLLTVYRGHGMLGLPILAGYGRFAIDMEENRLHLGALPERLVSGTDIVTLPLRFDEGMWIDATINGAPAELKIDIGGYSGSVLLIGSAAAAFMELHPSKHVGYSTGFGDAAIATYAARAKVVRAGDYELHDVVVTRLPDAGAEGADAEAPGSDGVVGSAFFGKTIIGVDWDAAKLHFLAAPSGAGEPDTRR